MPSHAGLLRSYALPVLWMFALPALALWFAGHAERRQDQRFLDFVEPQIRGDQEMTAAEQDAAIRYYREQPPSLVCASQDPQFAEYRQNLGDACSDFAQFGYLRQASLASIALGIGSLVFALACALISFVSRPLQYTSFVVGWNLLKVVGALQALLQGAAVVFLSYWMTALWFERYSVKLIGAAGVVVAIAVWKLLVAIFAKQPTGMDVEGELIEESAAPEFWSRIRALCAKLDTAPPQHLVAGIDDNFFVTEGEVRVGDKRLEGRTLFVSLSLLRILKRSEAEAVLAHEMAHFQGGDTSHNKRLSPMLARFEHYLRALHEGVVTRPIFHFMLGYYGLFSLSLSKSSREREFAADQTAAKLVSASDVAHSLLKVGAYASYRGRVENELFEQDEKHREIQISERVAKGFSGYATTETVHFDLHDKITPHPFDTHPRLSERLENVKASIQREQYSRVLLAQLDSSWVDAITPANDIERRLWAAYEARFSAAHELSLAYRYLPEDDVERAHVERFFPAVEFAGKEQHPSVQLDCAQITHAAWESPLLLGEIKSLVIEKRMFKRYLDLKLVNGGLFGGKRSICLDRIADADALVEAIARYQARHQAAWSAQQAA